MIKAPEKFQKVWYKTVRGIAPTSYPHLKKLSRKSGKVEKKKRVMAENHQNHMHIFRPCKTSTGMHSFKMNGG